MHLLLVESKNESYFSKKCNTSLLSFCTFNKKKKKKVKTSVQNISMPTLQLIKSIQTATEYLAEQNYKKHKQSTKLLTYSPVLTGVHFKLKMSQIISESLDFAVQKMFVCLLEVHNNISLLHG